MSQPIGAASGGNWMLVNLPVSVPQSRISNELPLAGVKPLIRATCSVPLKARLPLARMASYCVGRLRLAPPSSIFKVLVGENEMLPTVESVGDRPGSNVPLKVTLLNEPVPLIQPDSVICCEGELPSTVPLIVARLASEFVESIVPNP